MTKMDTRQDQDVYEKLRQLAATNADVRCCQLILKEAELKQDSPQFANSANA